MKTKFLAIAAACGIFAACVACSDKKAESASNSSENVEQAASSESIDELAKKSLTAMDFTEEEYSTMINYMDSNLDAVANGNPEATKNFTSFYGAVGSAADHGLLPESLTAKWQDVEARYKALQ